MALEQDWDALAERHRTPFLRHAWFRSWWRAFGGDRDLAIIALWDGPDLAALFPLAARGSNLTGLAGTEAPHFRPFGRTPEATRKVVEIALSVRPSHVMLPAIPVDDVASAVLESQSRADGYVLQRERMQLSPYVQTQGSYEDYLRSLNRDVRRVATARRRSLEDNHDVTWTIWANPADISRELDEALALENSGWKRAHRSSVLSSAATTAFYHEFARAFDANNRFALAKLHVDGHLAAVVIGLVDFARFWLLKTAYDETLRKYSPGMMLALSITERCFELELEAFELLGGLTEWKRRLRPEARAYDMLRLYRRRPLPLAFLGYRRYLHPRVRAAYWRARGHGL